MCTPLSFEYQNKNNVIASHTYTGNVGNGRMQSNVASKKFDKIQFSLIQKTICNLRTKDFMHICKMNPMLIISHMNTLLRKGVILVTYTNLYLLYRMQLCSFEDVTHNCGLLRRRLIICLQKLIKIVILLTRSKYTLGFS